VPDAEPTAADLDDAHQGHPRSGLRRLKVSAKLALAFGSLLALAATTAVVAFVGLRKVEGTWQQALHLGADLAQRAEKARASLQEARRHEKEFLLRWPDAGVALAFRTWVKASTTPGPSGHMPADVHGTVAADIAEFRAALDWIGKTLGQLQRTHGFDAAGDADLARLGALAGELGGQAQAYHDELLGVTRRLRDRGDIHAASAASALRTALGAPTCTGNLGQLQAAESGLDHALSATPSDAESPEVGARLARLHLLARQWSAARTAYAHHLDAGLPFREPAHPTAAQSPLQAPAADDEAATAACAPDVVVHPSADAIALADTATATLRELRRTALEIHGPWSRNLLSAVAKAEAGFAELRTGDDQLRAALRRFLCQADAIERRLDEFSDTGPRAVAGLAERAERQAANWSAMVYLIAVVNLLLGAGLAVWLAREIRVPLQDLAETAREVSRGNLQARAWVYSQDELGEFATTFNDMTGRIREQNARIAAQLKEIAEEHQRSERLLLNVLPLPIAERLKGKEHPIADAFDDASVLFADVVGYTALSARLPPTQVVDCLSRIFTAFDLIAQRRGVEKIKTIGDCYMAACGLPDAVPDHARRMADMALDMLEALADINKDLPAPLLLRIGLNCGPVVAGVIGERKFIYDLWGDTVNVASRMESHGLPGEVQLPAHMYHQIAHTHLAVCRGEIEVKGRGKMETYLLRGRLHGWDGQEDEGPG